MLPVFISAQEVAKLSPGFYQITKTGLGILDNYAKLYRQCNTAFDSASVQVARLKENYFRLGEEQAAANNRINELTIGLDQSQIAITNLKLENSDLKLQNSELKSSLKKEKRNSFFTKIGAGAISLAALVLAGSSL